MMIAATSTTYQLSAPQGQVPNALVEPRKHRELAAERILPEVELEDTFHFMSLMPPVRIGHGDLVKVRQERADQRIGRLARCHGCHIWFLWSLCRLWLSGGYWCQTLNYWCRRLRAVNARLETPPWLSSGRELPERAAALWREAARC